MVALAALGDDPVPLHLGHPDAPLRLPGLAAPADRPGARARRRSRPGSSSSTTRSAGDPGVGRAVRGAADVGDVPGDGLACAAPPGRDARGRASGRGARAAARAPGALPPRRLARAAHAGDDRARPPRGARQNGHGPMHEVDVALDELGRMERIVERLLLLAKADQPDFVVLEEIELERVPRGRLHALVRGRVRAPGGSAGSPPGTLQADPEALRIALDALLENAVKYTERRTRSSSARAPTARDRDRGRRRGLRHRRRTRSSASSTASRAPTRPAAGLAVASGSASRSSTRSSRRTAEAAPCDDEEGVDLLAEIPGFAQEHAPVPATPI